MKVERQAASSLEEPFAKAICELWEKTWPRKAERSLEERVAWLLKLDSDDGQDDQFHYLQEGRRLLAVCRSFRKRIRFLDLGREAVVLALAGVCVSEAWRGGGLGARIVSDAFRRLEEGDLEHCLFQTGVPGFYQKLGSFVVENEFVNSLSEKDPQERPWWEPWVMVHGERERWGRGRIDLLGDGY